jgi:hypothetical protein
MDSSYLSASVCQTDRINVSDKLAEESDMNIKRIGIDLAKQVFQIHGVDDQASSLDGACGIRAFEAPMSRIPRCYIRATDL